GYATQIPAAKMQTNLWLLPPGPYFPTRNLKEKLNFTTVDQNRRWQAPLLSPPGNGADPIDECCQGGWGAAEQFAARESAASRDAPVEELPRAR
ncbi:MAG TPA: hypothetical protein VGG64_02305, partial [Pirellulales bacterium]